MMRKPRKRFELIEEFLSRKDERAQVWHDKHTGNYFATYCWRGKVYQTKPTPYKRFAADDVLAEQYKKI